MTAKLHDIELHGDGSRTREAIDMKPGTLTPETHGLTELEEKVARQHQLLAEAARYLHEAAYLARYHQPALERHIRTFLDQIPA